MSTAIPLPVVVHVMAGLLLDPAGRVLLAQRPASKHLAGMWEFPGGKCEPGEAPLAALARELREELGITMQHAEPLVRGYCAGERAAGPGNDWPAQRTLNCAQSAVKLPSDLAQG